MKSKRGRPKGYVPYKEISYEDLGEWVGRKTKVPVSKKWLAQLMGEGEESPPMIEKKTDSQISYTLTKF